MVNACLNFLLYRKFLCFANGLFSYTEPLVINKTHMKIIIITIIFSFFLSNSYAQDSYVKLPVSGSNCPTVIIEKDIISNERVIELAKELIAEISILKDKPNRKEHKFFNLTANGIYFVSLKKKTPFKTQSELNEFFGIGKNNGVFVNGYLIEHSDYNCV